MSVRPTFMGLEIAKRGAMVSQKGLDIVGHNIMNATSTGYTRQRLDAYAVAPNTYNSRFASNRVPLAGQGVDTTGISQIRDKFLDKRFREEYGSTSYFNKASEISEDIEAVLNELGLNPEQENYSNTALQNALLQITNALSTGTSQSDSTTNATVVYTAFKNAAAVLRQQAEKLQGVRDQAAYDLKVDVDQVNTTLEKIAELNKSIKTDMAVTRFSNGEYYGPNELLDERNLLIDELSGYGEVLIENQPDGTVTVNMYGHTVVEDNKFDLVHMTEYADGTVSLEWNSNGKKLDMQNNSGSFKAAYDMINGRGENAQTEIENTTNGVRYYQDKLNAFAMTLARVANESIPMVDPETGKDYDPPQYKTLMTSINAKYDKQTGEYVNNEPVTAANISVSDQWAKDNSFVIYRRDDMVNGPYGRLKKNFTDGEFTFTGLGDLTDGLYTGTFEGFIEDMTSTLGTDTAFYNERLAATTQITSDLADRRDEVSGVSQDEETVNMITYSRSFQASGRIMTALDEALDVLINRTGLVGRA